MSPFEFTDSMNEISGFGGGYERGCRTAVCAGAQWFAAHPDANPLFSGLRGVYGYTAPENDAAISLMQAITAAPFTRDDGRKVKLGDELTGAMVYAAIFHLLYIGQHGWNAYVEHMSEPLHIEAEEIA